MGLIFHCLFQSFRKHKEDMRKLKKLLTDSGKAKRNRRNILNILIQILSWLVEFVGCFTVFFGSFILGHENSFATQSLQTLTMLFYFVILPSVLLINGHSAKNLINESRWYQSLIKTFGLCVNRPFPGGNDDDAN